MFSSGTPFLFYQIFATNHPDYKLLVNFPIRDFTTTNIYMTHFLLISLL